MPSSKFCPCASWFERVSIGKSHPWGWPFWGSLLRVSQWAWPAWRHRPADHCHPALCPPLPVEEDPCFLSCGDRYARGSNSRWRPGAHAQFGRAQRYIPRPPNQTGRRTNRSALRPRFILRILRCLKIRNLSFCFRSLEPGALCGKKTEHNKKTQNPNPKPREPHPDAVISSSIGTPPSAVSIPKQVPVLRSLRPHRGEPPRQPFAIRSPKARFADRGSRNRTHTNYRRITPRPPDLRPGRPAQHSPTTPPPVAAPFLSPACHKESANVGQSAVPGFDRPITPGRFSTHPQVLGPRRPACFAPIWATDVFRRALEGVPSRPHDSWP